ncbi:MAG: TIGR04283 family arsenosugar biosynthesis glycosyltransferase [Syntrophales bacterium]
MGVTFSIIIPVLGEAAGIGETIAHVRSLDCGREAEIVVADGDPAGETLRAIPPGLVRKVLCAPGRGTQLNRGAAAASGEVLVFLHADTRLPRTALTLIEETLRDKTLAGGAFDLAIASPAKAFRLIERVASLRTRLTRIPYGDQAIFLRRERFLSLGGFSEIPLMEDVDLMRRLKRAGGRIAILPARVSTSARRWEREGVLFTTLRNWVLVALFFLGADPRRLARWYRPHRRSHLIKNRTGGLRFP